MWVSSHHRLKTSGSRRYSSVKAYRRWWMKWLTCSSTKSEMPTGGGETRSKAASSSGPRTSMAAVIRLDAHWWNSAFSRMAASVSRSTPGIMESIPDSSSIRSRCSG